MHVLPLLAALLSASCDEVFDDSGEPVAECPLDMVLGASDMPCTCGGELVEAVPVTDQSCVCDSVADLTCV